MKLRQYTLVDARVGLRSGPFDASVYVENATNKAAELGIFSSVDGTKVYSARPRTLGLKLTGSF